MTRRSVLGFGAAVGVAAVGWNPGRAGAATTPASSPPGPTSSATVTAVDPFPQQADLNFETLFSYGESAYGAGQVGEVGATVALVQAAIRAAGSTALPAYDAYVEQFEALATRVAADADAALAAGHKVSARAKYLRAASYFNDALFFILGTRTPAREPDLYRAMQRCWAAAAALLEPAFERVEIAATVRYPDPAGGSVPITKKITIAAYLSLASDSGRNPTVIINNGSDAQFVDLYAYGAAAAVERGYNALIFEGPGQGSLLFEQNLTFTPYWEDVITPLVDYLVRHPRVDSGKLALTGWSFGGVLVFRAAAHEHRLAAVVGDPGFVDNLQPWESLQGLVQEVTSGAFTNANWQTCYGRLPATGPTPVAPTGEVRPSQPAIKFLVGKRGEIYDPGYHSLALAGGLNPDLVGLFAKIASYNADAAVLAQVRSHVLITQYEGDSFFTAAQGQQLNDQLTGAASRTIHPFTAAEGAQEHCAPLAPQLRNEVVFDWLDETLANRSLAAVTTAAAAPASHHSSGAMAPGIGATAGIGAGVVGTVLVATTRRRAASTNDEPIAPPA